MNAAFPGNYYPPNIGIAMHGHVHDFQALNFSSNHPATFVAGNGGDNLDSALPATHGSTPTPTCRRRTPSSTRSPTRRSSASWSWTASGAVGQKNWKFTSYRTNGTIIAVCSMAPPVACSGVCDTTPGTQITCTDSSGTVVGTYDNIP